MDNNTHFSAKLDGDSIAISVEGSQEDLVNLLANAIDDNEKIERLFIYALLAVTIRRKEQNGDDDTDLSDLFSVMKPKAQA